MSRRARWAGIWLGADEPAPRIAGLKYEREPLKRGALARVAAGAVLFLVAAPALVLPGPIGLVPYDYPAEFLDARAPVRYLIAVIGSAGALFPAGEALELPLPRPRGTGWRVAVFVAFVIIVAGGATLVRSGWQRAAGNCAILDRRSTRSKGG